MSDLMDVTLKYTINDELVDIPTLRTFSREGYRNYVDTNLFFVDHHGILRSVVGQWPYATKADQVRELVRFLQEEVLPRCEE